jgi:serine protease SohB
MEYFAAYGLFLAKTLTFVAAILFVLMVGLILSRKRQQDGHFELKNLNEYYQEITETLQESVLSKNAFRAIKKAAKTAKKAKKDEADSAKKRIFVLNFQGDMQAHAVNRLREEVTAVLLIATTQDEVVVRIDSPGGVVNGYGLAASQLKRIREHNIPLVAAVDKVAASGGYLMACVAPRIIASPFAIIGSIGVLAQLPNFHRLLKKHDIDFEQISGGEYKRTLSLFGENTAKARAKVQEEVEETHEIFKAYVHENRPQVDINKIATGEYWLASHAADLKLVDQLITSDEYLLQQYKDKSADIYTVIYVQKQKLVEKLQGGFQSALRALSVRFF